MNWNKRWIMKYFFSIKTYLIIKLYWLVFISTFIHILIASASFIFYGQMHSFNKNIYLFNTGWKGISWTLCLNDLLYKEIINKWINWLHIYWNVSIYRSAFTCTISYNWTKCAIFKKNYCSYSIFWGLSEICKTFLHKLCKIV